MSYFTINNKQLHPIVIFMIGLLFGAIIVALIFFWGELSLKQYQSSVMKRPSIMKQIPSKVKVSAPKNMGGKFYPTPTGS